MCVRCTVYSILHSTASHIRTKCAQCQLEWVWCTTNKKEWNWNAGGSHAHSPMKPDSLIMPKSIMRINFKNACYTWQYNRRRRRRLGPESWERAVRVSGSKRPCVAFVFQSSASYNVIIGSIIFPHQAERKYFRSAYGTHNAPALPPPVTPPPPPLPPHNPVRYIFSDVLVREKVLGHLRNSHMLSLGNVYQMRVYLYSFIHVQCRSDPFMWISNDTPDFRCRSMFLLVPFLSLSLSRF